MKEGLNKYKKLHDLAEKLANVIVKNEETSDVKNYFSQEETVRTMKERLEDAAEVERIYCEVEKRNKEQDIRVLERKIELSEERKLKRRRLSRTIVSASVAAALIAMSFVIYNNHEPEVISVVPEYVNRVEGDGIRIIQSNGEVQTLNEKKHIAVNGVTIADVDNQRIKYNHGAIDSAVMTTIVIPKTTRYTVVLEDGTEVYLGANSTLKYPSKFIGSSREVELIGEAYFKVAKDAKPFRVKVFGIEVKVYGTEFTVNSYNRNKIQTTLLSGSVSVRYNLNQSSIKEIKITPNQRLIVNSMDGKVILENNINAQKYISWRDGFFRSDEEPLMSLLKDIANWYDVEFVFENETVCHKLVSASLNSDMPIDSLMQMLEISTKIEIIKKEGGQYIIK